MDPETHSERKRKGPLPERTVFTVVPGPDPSLINTRKQCGEVAGAPAGGCFISPAARGLHSQPKGHARSPLENSVNQASLAGPRGHHPSGRVSRSRIKSLAAAWQHSASSQPGADMSRGHVREGGRECVSLWGRRGDGGKDREIRGADKKYINKKCLQWKALRGEPLRGHTEESSRERFAFFPSSAALCKLHWKFESYIRRPPSRCLSLERIRQKYPRRVPLFFCFWKVLKGGLHSQEDAHHHHHHRIPSSQLCHFCLLVWSLSLRWLPHTTHLPCCN